MSMVAALDFQSRQTYGSFMKKRQLTEEQIAECAALKAIYVAKKDKLGLTQEKAGELLGMNQGSFSHYLNGRNALNIEFAAKVAAVLQVPVKAFSERLAHEILLLAKANSDIPEVMEIREGMVALRASTQLQRPDDSKPWRMAFWYPTVSWEDLAREYGDEHPTFFRSATLPVDELGGSFSTANAGEDSCWLTVKGPAMLGPHSPSFPEGALILVRFKNVERVSSFFYIARHLSGELTFRKLLVESGTSYLCPLNPVFKPVEMGEEWEIIGRVVDARLPGL